MGRTILIKPLGGIAGDMFAGACAALWPDLREACLADVRSAGVPEGVALGFEVVSVNGFASIAFRVAPCGPVVPTGDYCKIVARLEQSALDRDVLEVASGILRGLAEAEAAVHGKPVEQVHFHELADWDSVADVVAAASFIHRAGPRDWRAGPLPMGGGTVETQHGRITVPAPAVLKLLEGFTFHDDGIPGERVTPTGAAILRYLTRPSAAAVTGRLAGDGFGAGTKRFDGLANVLQLVAFETAETPADEPITELAFDIDDMTPEEMATALDRLRTTDGVRDVTQTPMIGKKGRAAFLVRVLCDPAAAERVIDLCLTETSTLGVRIGEIRRRTVARDLVDGVVGAKRAHRPGGLTTAKAEADDLSQPSLADRRAAARAAEDAALETASD